VTEFTEGTSCFGLVEVLELDLRTEKICRNGVPDGRIRVLLQRRADFTLHPQSGIPQALSVCGFHAGKAQNQDMRGLSAYGSLH
jgi:hypothetical protein